jgi:integrase/recombinase XerC
MPDLAAFEKWLEADDRSPLTVRAYLQDLRHFSAWFEQANGKPLAPRLLTPAGVREYRSWLLRRGAAAATVNRRLVALSIYAKWAVKQKYLELNPTEDVKAVEPGRLVPKWLDKSRQNALIRQAQRELNATGEASPKRRQAMRDVAIIQTLLNTGLRVAELCALTLDDLTLGDHKGWLKVQAGKGARQRQVPLNGQAVLALKAWIELRPETDHRRVFIGNDLTPLKPRGVQERVQDLGCLADISVTPHILRHSFAKNLINMGVGLEKVAALLGHASVAATQRYATSGEMDLEEAVAQIGD